MFFEKCTLTKTNAATYSFLSAR